MDDLDYMGLALEEARAAGQAGDVPVGAVVVIDGDVVGIGRNRREANADPTAHAEIEALRAAATALGHWRVEGTLYVTHEPCAMCAGAIVNARVARLVFGCVNPKAGAVVTLYQIPTDARLNHRVEVVGGVRADECAAALREFFAELRRGPAYE
jgi:tRNA(adenine34) deaminase